MYLKALNKGLIVLENDVEFLSIDNLPKVVSVSGCSRCFLEAQNNNDLPIVVQPSEARNNDNLPVPIEPSEEKNENQILCRKNVKVLL